MSSPEQLNDVKPTKPKEVKLRRYGLYRMIPGVDLPEGQELLTVGKQAFIFLGLVDETPKIYLDADGLPDTKQRFNYFSRDADFDGDVQDGTPHQRRSRSLTHLIFLAVPKGRSGRNVNGFGICRLRFCFPTAHQSRRLNQSRRSQKKKSCLLSFGGMIFRFQLKQRRSLSWKRSLAAQKLVKAKFRLMAQVSVTLYRKVRL